MVGIEGGEIILVIAVFFILVIVFLGVWVIFVLVLKLLEKGEVDLIKVAIVCFIILLAVVDILFFVVDVLLKVVELVRCCDGEILVLYVF